MAGCEEHNVVIEKIKVLTERMEKTERKTDINTCDINELKQNKASNDEKFERVFELLGELKYSLTEIKDSIQKRNDRLPTLVYSVGGMVIGSVLSGVIVLWLTK